MEQIKVIARYLDGTALRGFTQDFLPNKDRFHVIPADKPDTAVEVLVNRLKAVFMVRDFYGDSKRHERKTFIRNQNVSGLKVEVTFVDGEVLVGSTPLRYDPKRRGNFLTPADQESNNIRVFVVSSAVKSTRQLFDHLLQNDSENHHHLSSLS
jgi:hypothetical protein